MLWLVSPGRTLQDALTAELLQRHLAGGYQLKNPPLYEWLLWAVQHLTGSGPLSYLVLRYSLIAAAGILFYAAVRRTVAATRSPRPSRCRSFCSTGSAGKRITASHIPLRSWSRALRCGSQPSPMPTSRPR